MSDIDTLYRTLLLLTLLVAGITTARTALLADFYQAIGINEQAKQFIFVLT